MPRTLSKNAPPGVRQLMRFRAVSRPLKTYAPQSVRAEQDLHLAHRLAGVVDFSPAIGAGGPPQRQQYDQLASTYPPVCGYYGAPAQQY